jgi:hypothetical protein
MCPNAVSFQDFSINLGYSEVGYLIKPIQPGDLIKRIIAMMAKNS